MEQCKHKWVKYQFFHSRKMVKKCSLCHKREPFTITPRFKFQDETVGFERLDFWTPPKEKKITVSKKKERIPTPLHYIAWKRYKYEKISVLNHWIIDHVKKIKRKEQNRINRIIKPRPNIMNKPFLIKDYDAIMDNYIKIIKIPLKE